VSAAAEKVGERLVARNARLALAESCTGGLVAAQLTERPGASRFLVASIVAYANEAKESLLGVTHGALVAHGAVSEAVAVEMLQGVRARTGAEAAIAVTGIAGPGGGTPEKPVGTVWIGASFGAHTRVQRFHFDGTRAQVRIRAAEAALTLLEQVLGPPPGGDEDV
jgi:PncC family amidohydrolase